MKKSVELTGKKQCLVDLGILMGKREAFATLAGRCSAAQAESLRRIHGSEVYRELAANWPRRRSVCKPKPPRRARP